MISKLLGGGWRRMIHERLPAAAGRVAEGRYTPDPDARNRSAASLPAPCSNPASSGSGASASAATAQTKTASASRLGAMSAKSWPLSRAPRTILQEMGDGEDRAEPLRPFRHAAEREHEAREQDRRQQVEDRELHRLELGAGRASRSGSRAPSEPMMNRITPRIRPGPAARHRHAEQQPGDDAGSARSGSCRRSRTARACRSSPRAAGPAWRAGFPSCRAPARG